MSINALGPGSFAWAVKEKIAWDEQMSAGGKGAFSSSTFQEWSPLIPLGQLTLSTLDGFTDEPDDIVQAFGSTLKIASFFDHSPEDAQRPEFRIGMDWYLPATKVFHFYVGKARLLVDPGMYASVFGENLMRLLLLDRSNSYNVQDLYTCHPATLPKLQDLTLHGWPALVFHPETLHKVPSLKSLELELISAIKPREELLASFHQESNLTLIDGVEEAALHSIGRRPVWTWDWYLPSLRLLRLTSEFAYLFQFRMLVGCPSLHCLVLNIEVSQQTHSRVLSLSDFIHVDGSVPDGDSLLSSTLSSSASTSLTSPGNPTRLIKTRIERLFLAGAWVLDDDLRATVFEAVFPDLSYIQESSTSGYSLRGWFLALRKLPRLEETFCWPADMGMLTIERLKDQGLVPLEGDTGSPQNWPGFSFNDEKWSFRGDAEIVAD